MIDTTITTCPKCGWEATVVFNAADDQRVGHAYRIYWCVAGHIHVERPESLTLVDDFSKEAKDAV